MGKQFNATINIGARLGSTVHSVFGTTKKEVEALGASIKRLKAQQRDVGRLMGMDANSAQAKKLAESLRQAGIDTNNLTGEQQRLASALAKSEGQMSRLVRTGAALDRVGSAMKNVGDTFTNDAMRLVKFGGLAVGAVTAVGAGIAKLTSDFANWADDIQDMAEALGISTEVLQTWQFAASTVGIDAEKMGTLIGKFEKNVEEGSTKVSEALAELGIEWEKLHAMDSATQLSTVAEAFKTYHGKVSKAALAQAIFGKGAVKLVGILNKGYDGLVDFNKLGKETGAIMDDEMNDAAGKAATSIETFGIVMTGLRNRIAVELVPALTTLVNTLGDLVRGHGEEIKQWAADFGQIIIERVVPALVSFLQNLPNIIQQVGEFATKFWDGLVAVKDFLGGWENLGIALVALNFAPTILAIGQLAYALYGLGAAWIAGMGPVGWVILGIIALTAATVAFVKHLDEIRDWFHGLPMWGKSLVVIAGLMTGLAGWSALLAILWDDIKQGWDALTWSVTNAVTVWKQNLEDFFAWFSSKWDAVSAAVGSTWEKLKNFFGAGSGDTAKASPSSFVPPEAMPLPGGNRTTNNTVNVQVSAPGQDGAGIARQIRTALQSQPLYDADSVLVPA